MFTFTESARLRAGLVVQGAVPEIPTSPSVRHATRPQDTRSHLHHVPSTTGARLRGSRADRSLLTTQTPGQQFRSAAHANLTASRAETRAALPLPPRCEQTGEVFQTRLAVGRNQGTTSSSLCLQVEMLRGAEKLPLVVTASAAIITVRVCSTGRAARTPASRLHVCLLTVHWPPLALHHLLLPRKAFGFGELSISLQLALPGYDYQLGEGISVNTYFRDDDACTE